MTESRMDQLCEELLQQSGEAKVPWEEVPGREYAYKVSFPDITLAITSWSPLRDAPWRPLRDLSNSFKLDLATYRLELQNDAGQTEETLLVIPGQANYRVLRDLFRLAHQQAGHSEKNIDKALEYLRGT